MAYFPVALQLYSLQEAISKDFEGTLHAVKEIGYDGVEFAGLFGHSAGDVAKVCRETGLIPISAHEACDRFLEDYSPIVKQYAEIGCQYIGIPSADLNCLPGGSDWTVYKNKVMAMSRQAREYGITLLYHNHDFEFQKVKGKRILDMLYEELPSDMLQAELDLCWVNIAGEDPSEYLRKYKGRAPIVHFKDFYRCAGEVKARTRTGHNSQEYFEFRPIGSGMQNIAALVKACEFTGCHWIIVEQDEPTPGMDALSCAAQSVRYLKQLFI